MRVVRRSALSLALLPVLVAGLVGIPSLQASSSPPQAPPPAADAVSDWQQINTAATPMLDQVARLRGPGGVLHLVYAVELGPSQENYFHTTVAADGTRGPTHPVLPSNWGSVTSDPRLLPAPGGGLRLVFSGLQDTVTGNFFSAGHVYTALSYDGGASWALQDEALTKSTAGYASYGTGATTLLDGTPVQSVTLNRAIALHVGTIPAAAVDSATDTVVSHPACCTYSSALARSGDQVFMAWYANGDPDANRGIFFQRVLPTPGPVLKAPGSSATTPYSGSWAPGQAVSMVVRPGGGPVVAYCGYLACGNIKLWDLATGAVHEVPETTTVKRLDLSAAPSGRLWVAWENNAGTVGATHTPPTGWTFAPATTVPYPTGQPAVYTLGIDAQEERVDVLVSTSGEIFHRQLLPTVVAPPPAPVALEVRASPKKLKVGKAKKVRVRVSADGVAVPGAKVRAARKSCTTRASGSCRIKIKPRKARAIKVRVSAEGFLDGSTRIKVKKAKGGKKGKKGRR